MRIAPSGPGYLSIADKIVKYYRHGDKLQIVTYLDSMRVSKLFFELPDFNICLPPSRVRRLHRNVQQLVRPAYNAELLREHWQPVFWKLLKEGQRLSDVVGDLRRLSQGWLRLRIKPRHPVQRFGVTTHLSPTLARWIRQAKANVAEYLMGFRVPPKRPLKDRSRGLIESESARARERRERDTSLLRKLAETIRCLACGNRVPMEEAPLPWKCGFCRRESFILGLG